MKKIVITSNCVSVPIAKRQQEERTKLVEDAINEALMREDGSPEPIRSFSSTEEAKRYFAEQGYVSAIDFAPSPFGTDVRHRFYRIEIVTDDDDECCDPDVGVELESELPEMIEFEGETYVLRKWGSYEHSANLAK